MIFDHGFDEYHARDWSRRARYRDPLMVINGRKQNVASLQLAERETQLSDGFRVREIRKRSDSGHPASILTSNFRAPVATVAVSLFARWSQENFLVYMRGHSGLDHLLEHGTEAVPDAITVVPPEWRKLDSRIRSRKGQRRRLTAQGGALALSEDPNESEVERFHQRKGPLREEIQALDVEIGSLKQTRKSTLHHLPLHEAPEEDRFPRLRTERKHSTGTLRMIACRAESSLASLLREHLSRTDDARALLRPRSGKQHLDRPAPPSHPSGSRSGDRATHCGTQRESGHVPGHSPDACVPTRLILISPDQEV